MVWLEVVPDESKVRASSQSTILMINPKPNKRESLQTSDYLSDAKQEGELILDANQEGKLTYGMNSSFDSDMDTSLTFPKPKKVRRRRPKLSNLSKSKGETEIFAGPSLMEEITDMCRQSPVTDDTNYARKMLSKKSGGSNKILRASMLDCDFKTLDVNDDLSSISRGIVTCVQQIPTFQTTNKVNVDLILNWKVCDYESDGKDWKRTTDNGGNVAVEMNGQASLKRTFTRSCGQVTLTADNILQKKHELNLSTSEAGNDVNMDDFYGDFTNILVIACIQLGHITDFSFLSHNLPCIINIRVMYVFILHTFNTTQDMQCEKLVVRVTS